MEIKTPALSYDDFRRQCGAQMAGIFRIYGMSEMQGHVLGALIGCTQPITLGDLTELLGAAKSTVSIAARGLHAYGLVLKTRPLGDRRDHYQVQTDMPQLGEHLLKRFLLPELQAGAIMLNEMQHSLDSATGDGWPEPAQRKILTQRTAALKTLTDGSAALIRSLLLPDGSLDQTRITHLITLLTQLQGEPR